MRTEYVEYHDDGSIEIFGNTDGMPKVTGVLPEPDCGCPSEDERIKRFNGAIDRLYLEGYLVVSQKRIKNMAFDKPGQRTSLKVIYRPCKNESECKLVRDKIIEIIANRSNRRDR